MSDDLDDLVRRAMKSLDSQVPSGYFEDLPNRTLARLEGTMQPTGTGTDRDRTSGAPPVTEDSGLHDIRNLAQSTKQRLSSKRISTGPVVPNDEDLVATSSAGWKAAVALPEPAQMVALPALDELPSKKEVLAKERAASAAEAAPELRERFARPAAPKKSRAPLAIAGVLVAAAAGVAVWFAFGPQSDTKSAPASERTVAVAAPAPAPVQAAPAKPEPAPAPSVEPIKEEPAAPPADEQAAAPAPEPTKVAIATSPKRSISKKAPPPAKTAVVDKPKPEEKPAATPTAEVKKDTAKKGKGGDENEPNFDDLLKEAGVDKQKKVEAPKLANKELSGDDFKKGMNAVSAKASACYKGTQGMASFKLIVAPSGHVSKVTVTGAFAGKPEGDCVERAVRGASFPPWDGGPQTFSYSYLLAE